MRPTAIASPDADHLLREDGRRFRLLIRHLDDVFWSSDRNDVLRRYFDAGNVRRWGLGEAIATDGFADWPEHIHEDDRADFAAAFLSLDTRDENGAARDSFTVEYRLVSADGSLRCVRDRGFAVRDERGALIQVVGIAEDVSERHRIERALHDSERELRIVTSAIPIGIAHIDRDLRYRFVNNAHAAQRHASTPSALVGQRIVDTLGEQTFSLLKDRIDQVLAGWTVDFEAELPLAGGKRWLHITMVPEHDDRKQVRGFIAVTEDITSRRLAQIQLHVREREFKTLAENTPDIIARVDVHLRYQYLNRAAEAAFRVNREHCAGLQAVELGFPTSYIEATTPMIVDAFASGLEHSVSFEAVVAGKQHFFLARAVPEFDHDSQLESLLLIVYDVSERVRVEIERDRLLASEQAAREVAERATRSRDEFLAIVSHELRSPLNGIQSWAQVLENTIDVAADSSPTARRAIAGIKIGVQQQVRMIDDLLDATRIITGKLSLSMAPVQLLAVLAAALESVRAKADDNEITLHADLRIHGETVDGDADRLQQIVWNLMSNAIKFTPRGGAVWLSAYREQTDVLIHIRDNGRGIDPGFMPLLFQRFQRDETGNSRGQDGFGLGLMLVRHLCELHRGSVVAASDGRGQGSVFTVRLPLREPSRGYPQVQRRPITGASVLARLDGVQLLLIDDHAESRDAMAVLLGRAGAVVEVLGSGEEALQRLAEPAGRPRPDLLICDIAMPGQDGFETLRMIRASERLGLLTPLPAIALTALVQNEDRIRAHDAGFEMHLSKPVAIEELIATIAAFVRHRERS